jgi:hypothetical protein
MSKNTPAASELSAYHFKRFCEEVKYTDFLMDSHYRDVCVCTRAEFADANIRFFIIFFGGVLI